MNHLTRQFAFLIFATLVCTSTRIDADPLSRRAFVWSSLCASGLVFFRTPTLKADNGLGLEAFGERVETLLKESRVPDAREIVFELRDRVWRDLQQQARAQWGSFDFLQSYEIGLSEGRTLHLRPAFRVETRGQFDDPERGTEALVVGIDPLPEKQGTTDAWITGPL